MFHRRRFLRFKDIPIDIGIRHTYIQLTALLCAHHGAVKLDMTFKNM